MTFSVTAGFQFSKSLDIKISKTRRCFADQTGLCSCLLVHTAAVVVVLLYCLFSPDPPSNLAARPQPLMKSLLLAAAVFLE